MTELLTAEQMRAIEGAAIASGDVTGLELMEHAGRGVVEAIFEHWPEYAQAPRRAVILCGPGNNGGDGFVVARLLAEQHWEVEVFLLGDPGKLPPDAKTNCERWQKLGPVEALTAEKIRAEHPVHGLARADIYLDALFGTGLTRAVGGEAGEVLRYLAGEDGDTGARRIVSVDAPSGLCLDSGRVLVEQPPGCPEPSRAPFADRFAALTVAFDCPKIGHFIADGPGVCGKLVVKDIGLKNWRCYEPRSGKFAGLPERKYRGGGETRDIRPATTRLVGQGSLVPDIRMQLDLPDLGRLRKKDPGNHKYGHGHALVLSGPAGRTGAARLAARGALRVGSGLVTVAAPGSAMMENACHLTAIMLRRCDGSDGLTGVLEDERFNALCLGPGLGVGEGTRVLVGAALTARRPTVLDADALTSFSDEPETLFEQLHESCVLTPHGGEFARLFPDIAKELDALPISGPAFSRVDAARQAAKRAGCVVLLKGPDTIIAYPSGICAVHAAHYDRTAPWLATAGAGDVLAGFITGLLARGTPAACAAELAAWLHVECARAFGPGLIAEDLPEMVPEVLAALE